MQYIFYTAIALIPSLIWLLYFLRKDKHPEPRLMVLMVFIWGMLVAFPALIVESIAIEILLPIVSVPSIIADIVKYLFVVSVAEEIAKYLVVKFRVIDRTIQLDEPVDAMEYMIISALGFAAIGYYIALSLYKPHKKTRLLIHGFLIAILMHGFYNIFVTKAVSQPYLFVAVVIIIGFSAYMISKYFQKVSSMKSITQI